MSSLPKRTILSARLIACAFAMGLSLACVAPAFAGKLNASALQDGKTYDRFIVRFNKSAPERSNAAARRQLLDAVGRGNGVGISQLRRLAVGADVIETDRKLDRRAAQQLMQRLARNPHVEYVELDAVLRPSFTPNDTSYGSQWHYFEAAAGINLPEAWDKATGSGVVVAVVDSGVAPHSDLSGNLVAGYDFISDAGRARDGNGRDSNPNDEGDWAVADECEPGSPAEVSSWHGTHIAGTIAAVTNNAMGVAGVAFDAKVMPLRALGKCGGYTSDIADAVVWAAGGTVSGVPANSNPAEVVNLSLSGHGLCGSTTQDAINLAVAAGTVVVVGAGNNGNEVANYSPANCSNVIAVAAVGRTGARASYSNSGSMIDVAAPGGNGGSTVLSTLNTGSKTQGAESYAGYQGTSMAAAHVAGTVALMQSATVNTPAAVEAILKSTARTFPVSCSGCGTGIIDASAAITGAINPALIIDDVTVTEGNSGARLATFTVTLSQPVGTVVSYDITTANGTAVSGTDYVGRSLTGQSIAAGVTSKTFTVAINGDTTSESTETFFVNLTNVVGVAVADSQAIGTISNDDPVPLGNGVPITGISGVIGQQFLYSMTVPAMASGLTFTTSGDSGDVDLYVKFGSAPTITDFDCASKTPTTEETCSISPSQAGVYYILLNAYSDISGVTLTGRYTLPGLSIADVSIAEGNSGTKLATFTVKLSSASATAVTYNIATANSTAAAGSDYVAKSLTGQSIAAGQTSKTFTVTINGDTAVEPNERFAVNVTHVTGASLSDGLAFGTILNDDGKTLSIADIAIAEGNSGTKLATFTVKLSQASTSPVTFNIGTSNGTALAGSDYAAKALTGQSIAAGQTSKTFTVTIIGNVTVEANETFSVNLSNAAGASIFDAKATGTILNDDGKTLSIADVAIAEGNSGTKLATFTVKLSQASTAAVTFNIATSAGTALAGSDYVAKALTGQSIAAGATSKTFTVTINGDTTVEANETFSVNLSAAAGASIFDAKATGTILNDDGKTLRIADVSIAEGNTGTKVATFTVTLSQASTAPVTYTIATANGTALAGSDYVAKSLAGQSIAAGATSKTFTVTINGDTTVESNQTFSVNLSAASGATILDSRAIGTILNDDAI